MSESDTSGEAGLPETPESEGSFEMELIECDRQRQACLDKIAQLEMQIRTLQEQLYNERLVKVTYDISDVHGGKSQAYLALLQRLQKDTKTGQEDIIPHENIAEHSSRVDRKLPILLVVPPDFGRQDLRQKLKDDISCFAPAVPHTTRPCQVWEEPGQDYHFVSESQFDSDQMYRRFIEFGEFENFLYGTSLEAIKQVVNSGKICLIKVRQKTVKVLRIPDLRPFTVYVAYLEPEEHEKID